MARRVLLPLVLAACLLPVSAAHALTITVTGTAGTPGAGVDGGPGGPAVANAVSGDASNIATANGGLGGSATNANGGDGGAATANAETNVAAPAVSRATANGGRGGNSTGAAGVGGDGGDATAEAHATGAGGSQARAIATGGNGGGATTGALSGGNGGDATLDGAVSGSDSTALALEQTATGGDGGGGSLGSDGGDGGDATSIGDFTNAAGGDLSVTLRATAGTRAVGFDDDGIGGTARVGGSATSSGAGDASIEATARGENLVLDPLLAHATGTGDASASLDAQQLGNDVGLSLTNALDAVADGGGAVTLRQSVSADGDTESILDVTRSAAQLELETNASGGHAAIAARGSNDAGAVRLGGRATGGDHPNSDPLDAVAEFEANTSGDGHDIEIVSAGATGGRGDAGPDIRGGDAEVVATATALGNSSVLVEVEAIGGDGSDFHGGNATARASGSGGGTETVDVTAVAEGGEGFVGIGGDALAEAEATGLGEVTARAFAHGGFHYELRPGPASGGFARATANGASGIAQAVASTNQLFDGADADDEQIGPVSVGLSATVSGETTVVASSQMETFADAPLDPVDGLIRSAYQAEAALLAAALAGNPQALAAPAPVPADEVFALVELQLTSGGGIARTFTADIVIGDTFDEFDPQPAGVLISFLDPEIDADAFGSLTLRSFDEQDPGDVYEVVFATALDALAFLDDGRLVFDGLPRTRHLEIIFETTGLEGGFFLDFLIAAVPEPSAFALLALAALALRSVVASRPK